MSSARAVFLLFASALTGCASAPHRRHHPLEPDVEAPPTASVEAPPVPLEACNSAGEGMRSWLDSFGRYAVGQGISAQTVASALDLAWWDAEIVDLDRGQRAAPVPYDVFLASHVTSDRVARGIAKRKALAEPLARMEKQFGVESEVLVAIWGLETDYGANVGNHASIRALATLAYDCRRSSLFRAELVSALRVIDRGDLQADAMFGGWAGEVGQTQFMPSSYEQFAVDFDGDGHADLVRSSVDALASTANFLKAHGWRARAGYQKGAPNFSVLAAWNASETWDKTIAAFAVKLGPAPASRSAPSVAPP